MAKQITYTVRGESLDGKLHDITTITMEGNKVVHVENQTFDTPEEKAERVRKLSAMCKIFVDA